MFGAISTLVERVVRSSGTLSGSFFSLPIVVVTSFLYIFYLSLLGAVRTRKATGRPFWVEVRANLRALCVGERPFREMWAEIRASRPPRRSWAEIRAEVKARRLIPKIKVVSVKAADLTGVVEYDSMHFSGMRVEECSDDWAQQLSEVKTDDDGRFALPHISDDPTHWVRVSWPGTERVHLRVELSPGAPPLHVCLNYRIRTSEDYWPGPPIERTSAVRNG
jgi:hypothetical protein